MADNWDEKMVRICCHRDCARGSLLGLIPLFLQTHLFSNDQEEREYNEMAKLLTTQSC